METEMDSWNDDRLDELNGRVKDGFAKVDEHFVRFEGEMKDGFAKVDERFVRVEGEMKGGFAKVDERFVRVEGEMKGGFVYLDQRTTAGFERINDRIDRIYYAVIVAAVGLIGTLLANGIWG